MPTLKDRILCEFPADEAFSPVTIVLDPDAAIADETVFGEIAARGYSLVESGETLRIREAYERLVRGNEDARLVILLRGGEEPDAVIPFDIRQKSRAAVDFSIRALFPPLDYDVVNELERRHFPLLFEKSYLLRGRPYNVAGTCEFILEKVFGLSASAITTLPEFLRSVYRMQVELGVSSPLILGYLADEVCARYDFPRDTFGELILDPAKFQSYVQREWDFNCGSGENDGQLHDSRPEAIVFENAAVRPVVTRMLQDGFIHSDGSIGMLEAMAGYVTAKAEVKTGKALDPFFGRMAERIPQKGGHADWVAFAGEWAQFVALAAAEGGKRLAELRQKVDAAFAKWLFGNYSSLASIPAVDKPVMVHRIPRLLSKAFAKTGKIALVVIDGMAWSQWVIMRRRLKNAFAFTESGTFAWIPTLTSVSRQSIFSGLKPYEFADSIGTTSRERKEWTDFWTNEGLALLSGQVHYAVGLGTGTASADKALSAIPPQTRVCGLVVNAIDDIMHGEQMGCANFLKQVDAWTATGYLRELLEGLVARGFNVTITSDHGNVESVGRGVPSEGSAVEKRGERVRVYGSESLRDAALAKCPDALRWDSGSLPPEYKPIVLSGSLAFEKEGTLSVSHGGISMEEVIVPFIRVRARD